MKISMNKLLTKTAVGVATAALLLSSVGAVFAANEPNGQNNNGQNNQTGVQGLSQNNQTGIQGQSGGLGKQP